VKVAKLHGVYVITLVIQCRIVTLKIAKPAVLPRSDKEGIPRLQITTFYSAVWVFAGNLQCYMSICG